VGLPTAREPVTAKAKAKDTDYWPSLREFGDALRLPGTQLFRSWLAWSCLFTFSSVYRQ
jgi:hypothetical protein